MKGPRKSGGPKLSKEEKEARNIARQEWDAFDEVLLVLRCLGENDNDITTL